MSFSVVVRVKVGKGFRKKGSRRDPNIHYSTYMCALCFFQQGAVLAAAFVRCKVKSPHISHILHPHHIQDKHPPTHVNLGSVGHNAMQPVHNMC